MISIIVVKFLISEDIELNIEDVICWVTFVSRFPLDLRRFNHILTHVNVRVCLDVFPFTRRQEENLI